MKTKFVTLLVLATLLVQACGGEKKAPSSPSVPGGSGGTPPATTPAVTPPTEPPTSPASATPTTTPATPPAPTSGQVETSCRLSTGQACNTYQLSGPTETIEQLRRSMNTACQGTVVSSCPRGVLGCDMGRLTNPQGVSIRTIIWFQTGERSQVRAGCELAGGQVID